MAILKRTKKAAEEKEEKKVAKKPAAKKKAAAKKPAAKKAPAKKKVAPKKAAAPAKQTKKDSRDAYRVLLRPIITEKAAAMASDGVYVFEVALGAGKVEVRNAVRDLYGITPRRVNIMNRKGKRVRFGRTKGVRRASRKAHVFLPSGKHLDIYEGV